MAGMGTSPHPEPVMPAFLDGVMHGFQQQMDQAALIEGRALSARDECLREAYDSGWRIIDIARHTGLSVSTVRMAVYPKVREKQRTAKRNARVAARPTRPALRGRDTMPGVVGTSSEEKTDESGI